MDQKSPLILLTNDDGIFSEGLKVLEPSLKSFGELYVVAPDRERNAAGHSITLNAPIYVNPEGEKRFSVSGTPSDCVNIGAHRLLPKKPDLVVSGINIGANLAEDITYSGTVAAAVEAQLLGVTAVAFSLVTRDQSFFPPAGRVAADLVRWVLKAGLPKGTYLNVNIPNLVDGSPGEIRWTRVGRKRYGDFLEEGVDEEGRPCFRFGRDALDFIEDKDSVDADWKAVEQGYVSVTPLRLYMTDEEYLQVLKLRNDAGTHHGQPGADTASEKYG